tara:strand:+ start:200 stop:520 length:321 start_codon:yes stop_codon:yes gene_type:complete
MKKVIKEMMDDLGNVVVESSIANLTTQKIAYDLLKESSLFAKLNNMKEKPEVWFQKTLNDMMMQSIDDLYNILDEDDAEKFIEMIKDGKVEPLSSERAKSYCKNFF